MAYNSQEQTIYRSLANQIQLGFYDDGERFPSAQEIAARFGVSYCPAQRALKALEREGLVWLRRGRETEVLGKSYDNYLRSAVFQARIDALADLNKSLMLLSPAVSLQGCGLADSAGLAEIPEGEGTAQQARYLYGWFERTLQALGSQTVLSLYYDINAFTGSAYLDLLSAQYGEAEAARFLRELSEETARSGRDCRGGAREAAAERLHAAGRRFFGAVEQYHAQAPETVEQVPFRWEPHKGRTRYCDVVAIDLICKISQGRYPVGTLIPAITELADTYHISPITVRRTVGVLNQLGVTTTINGVGTRVVFAGDASTLEKRRNLMLDENLLSFLEALQLLTILSESVVEYSFPYFSGESLRALLDATALSGQKAAMVALISACMQAVVHDCPLAAIREIWSKLTLLMVKGSVLRLGETGEERVAAWPALSVELRESLAAGDASRFARGFRRLARDNFTTARQTLLEMKIVGAERVAVPLEP